MVFRGPDGARSGPRKPAYWLRTTSISEKNCATASSTVMVPKFELRAELAELLLERAVADDRHRRGVAQAVGDRRLVVLDLLAQRVELGGRQRRLGGRQAAVGAEDLTGLRAS